MILSNGERMKLDFAQVQVAAAIGGTSDRR